MSDEKISDDVRNFIIANVESIGQLEVLCLIYKNKDRSWTIRQVSNELRSSDVSAERQMGRLLSIGIISPEVASPESFRYAPATSELSDIVDRLVAAFTIYPIRVIDVIYKRPSEALRNFAEAFKIRKDPKDG